MKQKQFTVLDPKCGEVFLTTTYMYLPSEHRYILPIAVYDSKTESSVYIYEPRFVYCKHCGALVLMDELVGTLTHNEYVEVTK